MFKFLKQTPDKTPITKDKVDQLYSKMRWQVFFGIFIGYIWIIENKNHRLKEINKI